MTSMNTPCISSTEQYKTSRMEQPIKIKKSHSILCLPYKSDRGHRLLNALRQKIKENEDINIQLAYTGKKLKSELQVKDSTDFARTNNVVYETICPSGNCGKRYIGETGRRLGVGAKEHLGEKSHLGQHTIRTGHRPVTLNDFKIFHQVLSYLEIGR